MKLLGLRFSPEIREYSAEEFSSAILDLLNLSKEEILISSFDRNFYDNEQVRRALESAVERGVDIEILLGKDAYPVLQTNWINDLYKSCKIRVVSSDCREIEPFIIVDKLHLVYKNENTVMKWAYVLAFRKRYKFLDLMKK